jgi:hypothetical protein
MKSSKIKVRNYILVIGVLFLVFLIDARLRGLGTAPPPTLPTGTPASTATPQPSLIPSITSTPDLPAMLSAVAPVLAGQPLPAAAAYDPNKPGPHPVLILSTSGAEYAIDELSGLPASPWDSSLPPGWLPASLGQTELVVLVSPENKINLGSASYNDNKGGVIQISRMKYEQDAEIRVARTGQTLKKYSFIGSDPPNFPLTSWESILYGTRFTYQDLEGWICPMVGRQACWQLKKEVETGAVNSGNIAFSPDGRLLASGTQAGSLLVWDTSAWTKLRTLQAHRLAITSLAFSPDGKLLASASMTGAIVLTDTAGWSRLATLAGNGSALLSIAFSPDGHILAGGSADGAVTIWDVNSRSKLRTLTGRSAAVTSVAFSPDGLTLASASKDGSIFLTEVTSGAVSKTLLKDNNSNAVTYIAFSPDGRSLAAGYDSSGILLWDVAGGTVLKDLMNGFGFHLGFAFSPDGKTLVADDSGMEFWDIAGGSLLNAPAYNSRPYLGMAFSPDGRTLVGLNDYELQIWK